MAKEGPTIRRIVAVALGLLALSLSYCSDEPLAPPAAMPALVRPENGSSRSDDTPEFRWTSAYGATKYQLQVDDENSFTTPVLDVEVNEHAYTVATALSLGQYYWRVRAWNGTSWSAFTPVWSFTIVPRIPELVSPGAGARVYSKRPTFDWVDVPGASEYEIQVATAADFSALTLTTRASISAYIPATDMAFGKYFWRVRAWNGDSPGSFADPWTFRIAIWRIEGVDINDYCVSMALDALGQPHVSHAFQGRLMYAEMGAGAWRREIVSAGDASGGVGYNSIIRIDTSGRVHIGYNQGAGYSWFPMYACKEGSVWHIERADSGEGLGGRCGLAIDALGRPHMSYCKWVSYDLCYAYRDSAGWHTEIVDVAKNSGWHNSIAVDAHGNPHICYSESVDGDLKYAVRESRTWRIELVDRQGSVGRWVSLGLDGGRNPHVSYLDDSNGALKYAYRDATGWHTQTIDWHGGWITSLALDSGGEPHIVYCSPTLHILKYAFRRAGRWEITTVDVEGEQGVTTESSLALDHDDHPWIAFHDDSDDSLRVAWLSPVCSGVEDEGNVAMSRGCVAEGTSGEGDVVQGIAALAATGSLVSYRASAVAQQGAVGEHVSFGGEYATP